MGWGLGAQLVTAQPSSVPSSGVCGWGKDVSWGLGMGGGY